MNKDIKDYAKKMNVYLWEVADKLGLQDTNFSKLLRHPLTDEKSQEIIKIIDSIAESR